MRILHVVPGLAEERNGIAVAAKLIADGQRKDGHEVDLVDARDFGSRSSASTSTSNLDLQPVSAYAETWVHSLWTPLVWKACLRVLKSRAATGAPQLVRMTHANLDPLRYRYHGWKKRLVAPIERRIFSKADRVVVTGEWEAEWCRQWGLKNDFQVIDLKTFFNLRSSEKFEFEKGRDPSTLELMPRTRPLHVLYLGRRHPLKGVGFLEQAVAELKGEAVVELRVESSLFGEEKEKTWEWCDVFCLPTLSENFGLVVAEALERGKRVITTDGAPAWEPEEREGTGEQGGGVVYIRGFRDGTDADRVKLLKDALIAFVG